MRYARKEYFSRAEIISEVRAALAARQPGEIDWITFVGSGETTLHSGIGHMIREVKQLTNLPVAVITNGSLLYLTDVSEELQAADAVLPSLDAGNAKTYLKVNRPWPKLSFEQLVAGLSAFRKSYQGAFWIEVMLVKDLNDCREILLEIAGIIDWVKPDQVHINVPTRPPAERWVRPPDPEALALARDIFGEVASVIPPECGFFELGGDDPSESILNIITRHPVREQDILTAFKSKDVEKAHAALEALETSRRAQVVERFGERFWTAAGAVFPGNSKPPPTDLKKTSRCTSDDVR